MKIKHICLMLFLLISWTSIAAASDWSTYGGDQSRTRVVDDGKTNIPVSKKWKFGAGWSISQPIIAPANGKSYFFHQAGGFLYRIPIDLNFRPDSVVWANDTEFIAKGGAKVDVSSSYNARSHPVYNSNKNLIYVGTGDGKVVEVNPSSMMIRNQYLQAGKRIVTAPHFLADGWMAIGNDSAELVFFKEGTKPEEINIDTTNDSSSEITGSFASVGNGVVVPLTYKGKTKQAKVAFYRIISNNGKVYASILWQYTTANGVATNIVYDQTRQLVYFTDKSGTTYALNATSGQLVWKNEQNKSSSTLVNNSAALYGDTLIVPYRYTKGSGTGMVIAYDVDNGSVKWKVTSAGSKSGYDGDISNDITIIKGTDANGAPNLVAVFGNSRGYLYALDVATGSPKVISYDDKGQPLTRLQGSFITAVGDSSYQGRGLATELLGAENHILFGANSSDTPNSNGTNGALYAYSIAPPGCVPLLVKQTGNSEIPIKFPTKSDGMTIDIGGTFTSGLSYNKQSCVIGEFVGAHGGTDGSYAANQPFKKAGLYYLEFNQWKIRVTKNASGALEIQNLSNDSKPLVIYIIDSETKSRISRKVISKGQKDTFSVPSKDYTGSYSIKVPTSLEDNGFWSKTTTKYQGIYPSSNTIPDQYVNLVQQLQIYGKTN